MGVRIRIATMPIVAKTATPCSHLRWLKFWALRITSPKITKSVRGPVITNNKTRLCRISSVVM